MAIVANNISGMNPVGLKPKPTYEEVINYILRDPENSVILIYLLNRYAICHG